MSKLRLPKSVLLPLFSLMFIVANFQLFLETPGASLGMCDRGSQSHRSPETLLCEVELLLLRNDLGKETGVGDQLCEFTPRVCTEAFFFSKGKKLKQLPVLWKLFIFSYQHSASYCDKTSSLQTLFLNDWHDRIV